MVESTRVTRSALPRKIFEESLQMQIKTWNDNELLITEESLLQIYQCLDALIALCKFPKKTLNAHEKTNAIKRFCSSPKYFSVAVNAANALYQLSLEKQLKWLPTLSKFVDGSKLNQCFEITKVAPLAVDIISFHHLLYRHQMRLLDPRMKAISKHSRARVTQLNHLIFNSCSIFLRSASLNDFPALSRNLFPSSLLP